MKATIDKWRKQGRAVTVPRTLPSSKTNERRRKKLSRQVSKSPTATLKRLQENLASTCQSLHVTAISPILYMSRLWGGVAGWGIKHASEQSRVEQNVLYSD